MKIPIFLSYPKPHLRTQSDFIKELCKDLEKRGLEARTLGVTNYDMDAPLTAVRRLLLESNGLIAIALRRAYICDGTSKPDSDLGEISSSLSGKWLTSPWCQIEPSMAYQMGLPILVFMESGVFREGILERGVIGLYTPEFDLSSHLDVFFRSEQYIQTVEKWAHLVRNVVENKGRPPQLY